MTVPSEQAHAVAVALDDQTEAILFDLVNPVGVVGDLSPAGRDARSKRCCGHAGEIGVRPSNCESNKSQLAAIEARFMLLDQLQDVFGPFSQLKFAATAQLVGNIG